MQNIAASVDILAKQLSVMDTKLDAITDKTTVMSEVILLCTLRSCSRSHCMFKNAAFDMNVKQAVATTVCACSTLRAVAEACAYTRFVLLLFTSIMMAYRF
jgi:hypothetical protein